MYTRGPNWNALLWSHPTLAQLKEWLRLIGLSATFFRTTVEAFNWKPFFDQKSKCGLFISLWKILEIPKKIYKDAYQIIHQTQRNAIMNTFSYSWIFYKQVVTGIIKICLTFVFMTMLAVEVSNNVKIKKQTFFELLFIFYTPIELLHTSPIHKCIKNIWTYIKIQNIYRITKHE